MAENRRFEIEEMLVRPGTYFNPQTEVMVVVDDSPSLDTEIFNLEQFEGADWILIADDLPSTSRGGTRCSRSSRPCTPGATDAR